MNKGLYTGYSAMAVSRAAQEIRANNLANLATPGYKADALVMGNFEQQMLYATGRHLPGGVRALGSGTPMVEAAGTAVNLQQGNLTNTGQQWDLALVGDGYFVLQAENELYYTRNGRFSIDGEGWVVNDRGWYLLSNAGPIQGQGITVNKQGGLVADGEVLGALQIVTFAEGVLEKVTGDIFAAPADQGQPVEPQILQGFLEQANTDLASEISDMLMLYRLFESAQRIVTTHDRLLELAANQLGEVRG